MTERSTMRCLVIFSTATAWLAGCSVTQNAELQESVESGGFTRGTPQSEVLERLGRAQREGAKGNYQYISYCHTDARSSGGDRLYDFVFRDGVLVYSDFYRNTRWGSCESFFRPIDWEKVERLYQSML